MKSTDKFLVGIVIGIVLIVVAAFAVTLLRPGASYLAEDTPANVVHNYLLALQREEYGRAHAYLSSTIPQLPDSEQAFIEHLEEYPWEFRIDQQVSLSVQDEKISDGRATVTVAESQFYGGGLFDSGQSVSDFEVDLELEKGSWKIVSAGAYFSHCWRSDDPCR